MEVRKSKDKFGYFEYELIDGSKVFKMRFGNNGDLYWSFDDLSESKAPSYGTFAIPIDDYFIYSLFEKLYLSIKNAKVYEFDQYEKELLKSMSYGIDLNENLKLSRAYHEIFNNGKITWISDDSDYDIDQLVQISKQNDCFILEFAKKDKPDKDKYLYLDNPGWNSIGIRFRNLGSSYEPFNLPFMDMYNALENYNPKLNKKLKQIPGQIHINEYLLSLK